MMEDGQMLAHKAIEEMIDEECTSHTVREQIEILSKLKHKMSHPLLTNRIKLLGKEWEKYQCHKSFIQSAPKWIDILVKANKLEGDEKIMARILVDNPSRKPNELILRRGNSTKNNYITTSCIVFHKEEDSFEIYVLPKDLSDMIMKRWVKSRLLFNKTTHLASIVVRELVGNQPLYPFTTLAASYYNHIKDRYE